MSTRHSVSLRRAERKARRKVVRSLTHSRSVPPRQMIVFPALRAIEGSTNAGDPPQCRGRSHVTDLLDAAWPRSDVKHLTSSKREFKPRSRLALVLPNLKFT